MTAEPSLYELIDARREWLQREEQKLQEQLGAVQAELQELKTTQSVAQRLVSQRQAEDNMWAREAERKKKTRGKDVEHTDPATVARVVEKTNELAAAAAEVPVQPGTVIVPEYEDGLDVADLPRIYQQIIDALTEAGEPTPAANVAEILGMDPGSRSEVEGLRTKMYRLADRGWIVKAKGGKFTTKD